MFRVELEKKLLFEFINYSLICDQMTSFLSGPGLLLSGSCFEDTDNVKTFHLKCSTIFTQTSVFKTWM